MPDGRGRRGCGAEESFADLVRTGHADLEGAGKHAGSVPARPVVRGPVLPDRDRCLACNDASWAAHGFAAGKLARIRDRRPEVRCDYHGLTVEQAWERLSSDLTGFLERGLVVVELVHGKGTGLLKTAMRGWLRHSVYVNGFVEPRRNSGSVLVVLKRL